MKNKLYITFLLLTVLNASAWGQSKLKIDTLQCSNVGFSVGVLAPSKAFSFATDPAGNHLEDGTMLSLYKPPYMSYGVEYDFKTLAGWLYSFESQLHIGGDNLKHRYERMSHVYTSDPVPIIIGTNGTDANVTCYNRGIALYGGAGKIFPILKNNPNSGPFIKGSLGWMQQQTIFFPHDNHAPQVEDDYGYLYDHQRHSFVLSEEIGFWYMTNNDNLFNFHVSLEISQCWSHSTRDYIIDDYLHLAGPDPNKYFDLTYMLKLCWLFPITGKPQYDYYYY